VNILVLGGNGMLGHTVAGYLKDLYGQNILVTTRSGSPGTIRFRIGFDDLSEVIQLARPDVIINCIGKIKPEIESNSDGTVDAIKVNSIFPHDLRNFFDGQIVQIATDCVFSGKTGDYTNFSLHDAEDVYGKTKSLGEVTAEKFLNIRCSIIGRELNAKKSLVEWVLGQPEGTTLNGYMNHDWNGITTHAFASVVGGLIQNNFELVSDQPIHLIPNNKVTKHQLLKQISEKFGRTDLNILGVDAPISVNRTLKTTDESLNTQLWESSVFKEVPSIEVLLEKYVEWLGK
jgi:dTDP-4-dehydrorhamnose reductase